MKKVLSVLVVLCVLILGVSCSKKKCDSCGSTNKVKTVEYMGQKGNLCENCYENTIGAAQKVMDMMKSY